MPSVGDLKATEPKREDYLSEETYLQDLSDWQAKVAPVIERITALLTPPASLTDAESEDEAAERRGFQLHRYGSSVSMLISTTLRRWEQRSNSGRQ